MLVKYNTYGTYVSNISKVARHRAWFERETTRFPSRSFVQRCFPIFLSYQHNPCLSWYHPISLHFIDIISFFQVQINTHDESFIYHKIGRVFLLLPLSRSIIILFLYGNTVHRTKQGNTTCIYLQIYVIVVYHRKYYIWRTLFQWNFCISTFKI